jgi:hypothetical protein
MGPTEKTVNNKNAKANGINKDVLIANYHPKDLHQPFLSCPQEPNSVFADKAFSQFFSCQES